MGLFDVFDKRKRYLSRFQPKDRLELNVVERMYNYWIDNHVNKFGIRLEDFESLKAEIGPFANRYAAACGDIKHPIKDIYSIVQLKGTSFEDQVDFMAAVWSIYKEKSAIKNRIRDDVIIIKGCLKAAQEGSPAAQKKLFSTLGSLAEKICEISDDPKITNLAKRLIELKENPSITAAKNLSNQSEDPVYEMIARFAEGINDL